MPPFFIPPLFKAYSTVPPPPLSNSQFINLIQHNRLPWNITLELFTFRNQPQRFTFRWKLNSVAFFNFQFPPGLEPPLSGYPLSLKQILKITPSFWEPSKSVHENCMKHLKWRRYISYYTKSIENIIIITLYIFRLNSVFNTDSLVRCCL